MFYAKQTTKYYFRCLDTHDKAGRGAWPGIDNVTGHGAKRFKSTHMPTLSLGTYYILGVQVSTHSD